MFTGIIEEIGTIQTIMHGSASAKLQIHAEKIMEDVNIGDSIAVNGVCLTVCTLSSSSFEADVMNETLKRTSLGQLSRGSKVNLERAMAANGRFGGHIVTGHIDGTGTLVRFEKDDIATIVSIETSPEIMHYIIEKGSIAIDGTSLTVSQVSLQQNTFQVSLIPHTKENTILLTKRTGSLVNLENDVVGKYIERFVQFPKHNDVKEETRITKEFLTKYGF